MIQKRRAIIHFLLAISTLISGCASHVEPTKSIEPKIEFLRGKYKICRENCPLRTPKELDEELPFQAHIPNFDFMTANQNADTSNVKPTNAIAAKNKVEATNIFFDFGMSKPNKAGFDALQNFVKTAEKKPITLIGGTDDIGTKNFNNSLATKRARFVKTWLLLHGITSPITIVIRAQCCRPIPYDKTAESLRDQRKVSVFLRQRGEGEKNEKMTVSDSFEQ